MGTPGYMRMDQQLPYLQGAIQNQQQYPQPEEFESDLAVHMPCMDAAAIRLLPRAHSMELHNDPRFFSSNVVEKRLAAFSGLSVIASLTTGTAMSQCFALSKRIDFEKLEGWIQVVGFLTMASILFMSLAATLVFVYQGFFTHRLATAGPTGFELAKAFYLHPDVVSWRHFGIKCLGYGLPTMLFSTGCMLYVKFAEDRGIYFQIHGVRVAPLGLATLVVFTIGSVVLFYIAAKHDAVFHREYDKRVHPEELALPATNRNLNSRRGPLVPR